MARRTADERAERGLWRGYRRDGVPVALIPTGDLRRVDTFGVFIDSDHVDEEQRYRTANPRVYVTRTDAKDVTEGDHVVLTDNPGRPRYRIHDKATESNIGVVLQLHATETEDR